MWSRCFSIIFLLITYLGQAQYADDWIKASQQYYKIKIIESGVYRVTANELSNAGVSVNNVPINRYQLFRKGKEVAIRVVDDNGDNLLDYFEFYGEQNDGSSDTELYASAASQPNVYYNLFSDTATYFLTWHLTNTNGKRMGFSANLDVTGLTPKPYHLASALSVFTDRYSPGGYYGVTNEILNPKYDVGEGWVGSTISRGQSRDFNIDLSNFNASTIKPQLEILFVGANNNNHVLTLSAGPNAQSLRELATVTFQKAEMKKVLSTLEWSDVGTTGNLLVRVTVLGESGASDLVSVANLKIDYPQYLDFYGVAKDYQFEASTGTRAYVSVPTTNASNIRIIETTNPLEPKTYAKSTFSDRLAFVFLDPSEDRSFHLFSETKSVSAIQFASFDQLNFTNVEYLIISHPSLNTEVDGVRPVEAYETYRESVAGGRHNVLTLNIQQVFDQFGYGDPGPVSIRNLVRKGVNSGSLKHLFLIGKGTTVNFNYYRKPGTLQHFVPTFGYPGADALFSVDVKNGNNTPLLSTGRLSAVSSSQVKAYLDKIKEAEALPFDNLWRKNLIHLSGGITAAEQSSYANFVNNFKSMAEGDFLGGNVDTRQKQSTDPKQIINVAQKVNEGVSQITFFGHSSSIVTDIEIGKVSAPEFGYSNKGKYPVILVNGCNAGGIFSSSTASFGEDWINTADAGALGFVANSDFAQSSALKRWSDLYYLFAFANDNTFALPLGEIVNLVADRYLNIYGVTPPNFSQVYQTVLQGDPAVKVFGADKPDYGINSNEIYASAFDQERVVSNADSFQIQLVVKNYGRTVSDSVKILIERTYPDARQENVSHVFKRVLRQDTLAFTLYNGQEYNVEGVNTFKIILDPENEVEELSKTNNTATFELFIPRGNTLALYPPDFGIVSENEVSIIWQSANQLEQNQTYSLEIDTISTFNSPFNIREEISADVLVSYPLNIANLPDSTVVYWRTRFTNPDGNEDTTWVISSFTKIPDLNTGWAQTDGGQFESNNFVGVTYDPLAEKMSFLETFASVQLNTHGATSSNTYENYQVVVDGLNLLLTDNLVDPDCKRKNAINAVVFNKQTALPYRPLGITGRDIYIDWVCGRAPQMIHNFSETDVIGGERFLDSLISAMGDGDMILLFSFGTVNYSKWDEQLISSLASVGVRKSTLSLLIDGQPVIFLGRKGVAEGSALEIVTNGSGTPITEQSLQLISQVSGKYSSGNITSPRIGPATNWLNFFYDVDAQDSDLFNFILKGITETGEESVLFAGKRTNAINISNVDATQYPYIQMEYVFSDPVQQTPPNLNFWSLEYAYPPEGLLMLPDQQKLEVEEGAPYSRTYAFSNISNTSFSDSLDVEVVITTVNTEIRETQNFKIGAPEPGDTVRFEVKTATRGKSGSNNLLTKVQSQDLESYTSNNIINQAAAFIVNSDNTNPVLDVTFDGGYILDGDIVSPTPTILVKMKDENQYLMKDDTTGFILEIRAPCETCVFERVRFSDPQISYEAATESEPFKLTYQPGPLSDGIYALRVNAADVSGNFSGLEPYEITFEVINESTITHFYPYPNPFSTQTRFVFTLTGSTIPDRIKIQIMTVSGRVVREITQDEIGPIRIGNNISQYAWDGRDEFGDPLANGVYLYKVFIENQGQQLSHRNTLADRGFKNGFGKLYILR